MYIWFGPLPESRLYVLSQKLVGLRVRDGIIFGYINLHGMTNFIIKSLEVGVQLPEQWVRLHLHVWQCPHVWGNGCTHYPLTQQRVNLRVLGEERHPHV